MISNRRPIVHNERDVKALENSLARVENWWKCMDPKVRNPPPPDIEKHDPPPPPTLWQRFKAFWL